MNRLLISARFGRIGFLLAILSELKLHCVDGVDWLILSTKGYFVFDAVQLVWTVSSFGNQN